MTIENEESICAAIVKMTEKVLLLTCSAFKDYGLCKLDQKHNFLYSLKTFMKSMKSMIKKYP